MLYLQKIQKTTTNYKMKKTIIIALLTMIFTGVWANRADSVFVASYNVGNGLRMAYSVDKHHWTTVGNNFNLLQSDFGAWGAEKKMVSTPSVIRTSKGEWFAVWALNNRVNQFATSHTKDLSCWVPQDYPYTSTKDENVINPRLAMRNGLFVVTYTTSKGNTYETTSKDFIHWSDAKKAGSKADNTEKVFIDGAYHSCDIAKTTWSEIQTLIAKAEAAAYRGAQDNTGMGGDSRAFGDVKDHKASLKADLANTKKISPELFGIFFEDINYAADGGIYAELLQNRDFEYNQKDGRDWNARTAWDLQHVTTLTRDMGTNWTIKTENPLHKNNPNYAQLDTRIPGMALVNSGFEGISVKKGEKFDFSVFLRTAEKNPQKVRISLRKGYKVYATALINIRKGGWKQYKTILKATEDCKDASLSIEPVNTGVIDVDFASLFPQKTFMNRKNGLRADLAQALADIHPKFVRFPGGCASHGNGIDNIYHWQATVGPLWERQYDWNIWHYHQSRGLGFYEYFQFCEDMGAQPLPVLAAGVPCQNSAVGGDGQQGGIPWERDLKAIADKEGKTIEQVAKHFYNGKPLTMESYLQELLDLIEWANGDAKTSKLAKMRADAGHVAPFNMKYLGIGNEDLISEVFLERYKWLIKEVKKAHPEITVVGTVGPFWEGSDYEVGWDVAREENIEIVDEHYYNPVGWYLNHQDFYDKYSRTGTKVYLGEWASKGNRWENALAEAIHITNIERNADVVVMSSYAPLLAREGHTQWNPDLIYFNNTEVKPTPNYYVQMLSGQNNGVEYVYSDLAVSNSKCEKRVKASIVKADNGDIVLKIVNALPAETAIDIDLGDLSAFTDATLQQIDAKFDARDVTLNDKKTISTEDIKSMVLPAYSFTVVRLNHIQPKRKK